jgi:hypothetical protein
MRRESRPANEDVETIAYRFHFQMAKDGARQACIVEVQASNIHEATARSGYRTKGNPATRV